MKSTVDQNALFPFSRCHLIIYSSLMVILFLLQLCGIFASMELRAVINRGEFTGVDVLADLKR